MSISNCVILVIGEEMCIRDRNRSDNETQVFSEVALLEDQFPSIHVKKVISYCHLEIEFFAVDVVHIAHFSVVHAFLSRKVEICFC